MHAVGELEQANTCLPKAQTLLPVTLALLLLSNKRTITDTTWHSDQADQVQES